MLDQHGLFSLSLSLVILVMVIEQMAAEDQQWTGSSQSPWKKRLWFSELIVFLSNSKILRVVYVSFFYYALFVWPQIKVDGTVVNDPKTILRFLIEVKFLDYILHFLTNEKLETTGCSLIYSNF